MKNDLLRSDIVEAIRVQWQKGFLAGGDGNFSFKDDSGQIWITPSGVRKHKVEPEDFVKAGDKSSSSELKMHLKVFKACPKAKVVFHSHPPTAIAWSIANPEDTTLPGDVISELVLAAGSIPIVPYAKPGTEEMGENLNPFLPHSRVLVLKRHGALSWGESVDEALTGIERLEHSCEVLYKAKSMGHISRMSKDEYNWLLEKRKLIGERTL